jgi:hypothetical protein
MAEHFIHLDTRDIETTESFFSNRFINARIDSGLQSNEGYDEILEEQRDPDWHEAHWKEVKANQLKYDEDVNQYITLTLSDLAKPQSVDLMNRYVVNVKSDAGQVAFQTQEQSKKFIVYRVNADYLLLTLGLFRSDLKVCEDAYIDKGREYYFSAANNLKGVFQGRSAMSDVMEKLSNGFGKYVKILQTMREADDNYMSFHFKFSQPEIETLEQSLTAEVHKDKLEGPDS